MRERIELLELLLRIIVGAVRDVPDAVHDLVLDVDRGVRPDSDGQCVTRAGVDGHLGAVAPGKNEGRVEDRCLDTVDLDALDVRAELADGIEHQIVRDGAGAFRPIDAATDGGGLLRPRLDGKRAQGRVRRRIRPALAQDDE